MHGSIDGGWMVLWPKMVEWSKVTIRLNFSGLLWSELDNQGRETFVGKKEQQVWWLKVRIKVVIERENGEIVSRRGEKKRKEREKKEKKRKGGHVREKEWGRKKKEKPCKNKTFLCGVEM